MIVESTVMEVLATDGEYLYRGGAVWSVFPSVLSMTEDIKDVIKWVGRLACPYGSAAILDDPSCQSYGDGYVYVEDAAVGGTADKGSVWELRTCATDGTPCSVRFWMFSGAMGAAYDEGGVGRARLNELDGLTDMSSTGRDWLKGMGGKVDGGGGNWERRAKPSADMMLLPTVP